MIRGPTLVHFRPSPSTRARTQYVSLGMNDLWLSNWTRLVDSGEIDRGNWYYCGIYVAFSLGFGRFWLNRKSATNAPAEEYSTISRPLHQILPPGSTAEPGVPPWICAPHFEGVAQSTRALPERGHGGAPR